MKKTTWLMSVAVLGLSSCTARIAAPVTVTTQSFNVGGVPLVAPPPPGAFVEIGYDNRELMEVFVPTENRLLCAFVPAQDLQWLTSGASGKPLEKYGMVQVLRQGEYVDCEASDFEALTGEARELFGDNMASYVKDAEDEFNRRMRALDLDTVSVGQPAQLGCFFSKPNACGLGMINAYSMGGETTTMGMVCAFVRVKRRLLFVYLYAHYEDENTIRWLRRTSEDWCDAIVRANM